MPTHAESAHAGIDHRDLSEQEVSACGQATLSRALAEPMPRELEDLVRDLIEPHTICYQLKHRDVMSCIEVAFPHILDYLREHPEALNTPE